jgi:hypothetical protein
MEYQKLKAESFYIMVWNRSAISDRNLLKLDWQGMEKIIQVAQIMKHREYFIQDFFIFNPSLEIFFTEVKFFTDSIPYLDCSKNPNYSLTFR